jgi:hypothetical protein
MDFLKLPAGLSFFVGFFLSIVSVSENKIAKVP